MRPCQIVGCEARARSPRLSGSTGPWRHSTSCRPLDAIDAATMSSALASHSKGAATANSPPRRRCGTGIRSPAPSPLLPPASSPPRCDSRASACTPRATAWWASSGVATKPMPQAARLVGRAPGQARRDGRSAGGTESKVSQGGGGRAKGSTPKEPAEPYAGGTALKAQQGLDPQRYGEVEAGLRGPDGAPPPLPGGGEAGARPRWGDRAPRGG